MASAEKKFESLLFRHRQLAPAAAVRGGNFIDTASGYQNGHSEMLVGEWMMSRKNRDEIVLATKYTTAYMTQYTDKIQSNFGGNNAKSMKISVDASLRKLQTSYIDLLYVHWWDYTTSIPELMHALNDLVASGKVVYLGISDTPAWVVAKANQYARDHGLRQFSVYQGMWNAAMRDFERDIIPMARDEGMALCPYGVLNQGRFQTKEGFEEREKHNPGRKFIPTSEHDMKVSAVLESVSNEKGVPLLNVALAYVMRKAPYVFPIVGGRKVEHLRGSIDALNVVLTRKEMDVIEGAYPFDFGFPHTFLSGSMFDHSTPKMADKPSDVWLTKVLGKFDWVDLPEAIGPSGSSVE
ncbi:uncharacterized protein N7459_005598 [Penicillium hispanicum]|uniref:uncharacterized protein n=1 Tax=Penicillium hispanicum TaxID=1080232 RepID=UPI002540499F|nr:uncharacterized protein N7459_005598 [Penicillium hispanicum]KAJ5579613.1 hypothetical protein N7459_005598 [Penicillium hispanicum]